MRDLVVNFFVGRTLEVSRVRFDTAFKRTGHVHFFLDALSHLRIAWCPEFYVLNDPGHCDPAHWNKKLREDECYQYANGRYPEKVWTKRDAATVFDRSFQSCRGRLTVDQFQARVEKDDRIQNREGRFRNF